MALRLAMQCVKICLMEVQKRYFFVAIVLSAAGGYYLRIATAQLETKIVTRDIIRDKIVTVTRTVKAPDGTIIRDRRTETDRDTTRRSESVVQTAAPLKDWRISGGYMADKVFTGSVERRALGPIFIGVQADSSGRIGASIGVEF